MEQKVAREVAEQEFMRFIEAMDLEVDEKRMDADDLKSFAEVKAKLLRAMEEGHLVVDEKGQPVYTPRAGNHTSAITFYEPTGASFMAMDTKKKDQNVAKMHAVMADMTRLEQKVFAAMPGRDLKICQAIVTLFLGLSVATPLVRGGGDAKIPKRDGGGHTLLPVYGEMLLQVCRDYPALSDPRSLTMTEIRFFYEGLRYELKEHTKPRPKPTTRRR